MSIHQGVSIADGPVFVTELAKDENGNTIPQWKADLILLSQEAPKAEEVIELYKTNGDTRTNMEIMADYYNTAKIFAREIDKMPEAIEG